MYIPQRQDFVWLNFDPQAGHEQTGKRPALVVSQDDFNRKMGLVFVCPISNIQSKNPFYVPIPEQTLVTGVIMADQMRSLDYRARQATFLGKCPQILFQDVLRRIRPILF